MLKRWVNLSRDKWFAGGDHNHLIRDGAENKNYGGTPVTLEFAAALMASRGWNYFAVGGGGPWIVQGDTKELQDGRLTQPAITRWNQRFGKHLSLSWNNEIIKSRYGHVWFLGESKLGPTYPYTSRPGDAWWAFYDDSWDPWQTGDKSKSIGPLRSALWDLPPVFDCIKSWQESGLISIYAHPTRTFMIGENRVSNIAVEFPFDLLTGAPVGGLAVMGDSPNHPRDQALWSAALNEGYQVPGIAENDTVFGRDSIRLNPHVTYTHVPAMPDHFDLSKLTEAMGSGRNFVSSGAFCTLEADGIYRIGDTVLDDGQPHSLDIHAWASSDPLDTIESLEIVANGKVVDRVHAATGKREFTGKVSVVGAKWVLAKVICRNHNAVAITNPIYFRTHDELKTPAPLSVTVSGRVTLGGSGVPAEILVSAWGKEIARSRAGDDGAYRLEEVPLAAHLAFKFKNATRETSILFSDPEIVALHAKIWATDFVDAPDALGGVFPPEIFALLRDAAKHVTVNLDLGG